MPSVKTSAVRTAAGGMLAVAISCLLLSADLGAQTDKEAEAIGGSLAICRDEGLPDDDEFEPCEQYIDVNIKSDADTINWMLEQIEDKRTYAQGISNAYYARDEIVQWILVIVSLFTTISAAITKLYPKFQIGGIDFAIAPIVLSAIIAAVTSINAYYQFDQYSRLSQNMADDMAELESDIHFLILRHVAGQPGVELDESTIKEWHERLKTIIQRYSQRDTGNGA